MRSVAWLGARYLKDGMSCAAIARLIGRDPKTVWSWMKRNGIKTRGRGRDPASQHGWSNLDVSHAFGRKLSRQTKEKIRKARIRDGRVPWMVNGKHWLHVYGKTRHPRWRGGITPERQRFYASPRWARIAAKVWTRDKSRCQKCKRIHRAGDQFDIHHIVSFECRELRGEISNLILLCEPCHYWVHGPKNTRQRFIRPLPQPKKGGA